MRRCFFSSSSSSSSSSSLCVFFACFLARASRVCLAFSSPRARFESIEEQRERLRCIVHRIPIGKKKAISMSVSLSYRSNETTACQPKVVTMDRAKSIDRRVPMTQQSSNEYACPCFFLCVCARKSACASNPPGCFLYEDSPKATLLFLPFVFDNNKQASWKSRTKTGKNS